MGGAARSDGGPVTYRFDGFTLDPADRRLLQGDAPVELNARYFDALALLVREPGALITKDRFMAEVWAGIPVTDEALTQCIRTLRKRLGDEAARPRFIETVPKHGYRFVAAVEALPAPSPATAATPFPPLAPDNPADPRQITPIPAFPRLSPPLASIFLLASSGVVGGGIAGLAGGIVYGSLGTAQPGVGALSALLVLASATLLVALLGAAGVGFGIALASRRPGLLQIVGGAVGGLLVGAIVSMLARDAFTLLVGYAPVRITGAPEGAALGAAAGLGVWAGAWRRASIRRGAIVAAGAGLAAGLAVALSGGKLMAGTLALLAGRFPESRFSVDGLGTLFGEDGFGPVTETATASLEAGLFCACVAAAMVMAGKLRSAGERGRAENRD